MKHSQMISVGLVVMASFFLVGFKKQESEASLPKKYRQTVKAVEQRSLDLTIPQRNLSFDESSGSFDVAQGKESDGIYVSKIVKSRAVELSGHLIMSPEPEVEKSKSTDGAGIVINLHH